jgi:hypothetical protein
MTSGVQAPGGLPTKPSLGIDPEQIFHCGTVRAGIDLEGQGASFDAQDEEIFFPPSSVFLILSKRP